MKGEGNGPAPFPGGDRLCYLVDFSIYYHIFWIDLVG